MFKVFDQEVRQLDYRLGRLEQDDEEVDDEIEKVMTDLFFIEGKIYDFEEALSTCTDLFLFNLSQLEDDDTTGRNNLQQTYETHRSKVEELIKKLVGIVCLFYTRLKNSINFRNKLKILQISTNSLFQRAPKPKFIVKFC